MENLKIKVNNEAESKEAQELFFELGAHTKSKNWLDNAKWLFLEKDMEITFSSTITYHSNIEYKEITLPELRDMVVLKRNDVRDATHVDEYGDKWRFINNEWCFMGKGWNNTLNHLIGNYELKPIEKPMKETELPFNTDLEDVSSIEDENNHYFIDVSDVDRIDFYEIARRYKVADPCVQHILKKCLAVGDRGYKDFKTDIKDIYKTARRATIIHGISIDK